VHEAAEVNHAKQNADGKEDVLVDARQMGFSQLHVA
jgi:hypothetical protein